MPPGFAMGTDRDEYFAPCLCGAGEFVIEVSTPNHGWSASASYRTTIACSACASDYVVVKDGCVVRRTAEDERRLAESEWTTAWQDLMRSTLVRQLLADVAAHLDGLPSKAAIYRRLDAYKLAGCSRGHFTRTWAGGAQWAQRMTYLQLPDVLAMIERSSPAIDAELARTRDLKSRIPEREVLRRLYRA